LGNAFFEGFLALTRRRDLAVRLIGASAACSDHLVNWDYVAEGYEAAMK
jgi:hypothetical protein